MKFLIISHTPHKQRANRLYAYAPYVREMNLWLKYVESVVIVAPEVTGGASNIELDYQHESIQLKIIPRINFVSLRNSMSSVIKVPRILIELLKACRKADHIHLRCPGNIGLLGCFVQFFFPKKIKTAKYAGNWDPDSRQPFSYKVQKWLLSNVHLTKNMQVLVYGSWKNQSKNIKPFFTATYSSSEIIKPAIRNYNGKIDFVFIGSLVEGKRPLLAIKIVEALTKLKMQVNLEIYGDGVLRKELERYVTSNQLKDVVVLKGNKNKEIIVGALKKAHFLILPSKSEGWPKVVSEAMFYGTIPIASKISCVPDMLDFGNRGILIEPKLEDAVDQIKDHLQNEDGLRKMSEAAYKWSQNYTLETFEAAIAQLINK